MPSFIALAVILRLVDVAGVPPVVLLEAQREVTRVYRAIGVDAQWTSTRSLANPGEAVLTIDVTIVSFETGALKHQPQPVLGVAVRTPAGTRVAYVFYRRVETEADQHGVPIGLVLASALAHEIGHHLLPSHEHSPTGLMRACWDREDFNRAARGQLRFSDDQGVRIRARLQRTTQIQN
jgi:hypothetical protein